MTLEKISYPRLIGELVRSSGEAAFHPRRAILDRALDQFGVVGVKAVPLVVLITITVGYVLALVLHLQLARVGMAGKLPTFLWVMLTEQIVPLSVAMVLIGRSVSSLTAELGSMQVSEEIKALYTMGVDISSFLLWPRFIGFLFMLPVLTLIGIYGALFGGWLFCGLSQNMSPSAYVQAAFDGSELYSLILAAAKALVFGFLAAIIALQRGLNVRDGSREISAATTNAVVASVVAVTLSNAALTTLQLIM